MGSKWQNVRLGDVVLEVIDNRGKTPPCFKNGEYELIEVNAISATNKFPQYREVKKFVTQKIYETWFRKGHPKIGDILIPTVGTLGSVSYMNENRGCIAQNLIALRTESDKCLGEYLYYHLCNPVKRQQLLNLDIGGVQPSIKVPHLLDLEITLPPLPIQRAIAATLSCLDDKIDLNNRINANLEAQAQAIFKSWFVDFEPWGGIMPDDWKIIKLDDLCDTVTKGTTPTTLKRQFIKQGINFIKAESILANHSLDFSKLAFIDKETNSLLQRSTIQENDIIFTIAGTLGRFAFVGVDLLPANTNQAVAIIRADTGKIKPITLYSFFIGGLHSDFYAQNIQQAVQANLSLTTIKALPLAIPSGELLAEYTSLIEPIFEQIFRNHREAHTLSAIRDALLPRVMSREIELEND